MVSEIKSNTNDLLVVAGRLYGTAHLEGTVDTDAWRKVMRDLADQVHHDLIVIYKELDATEAEEVEREHMISVETACGDTDREYVEA
ncbi:MAG TPA: hypothetical protein VMX79_10425 [bacterium]|nr:hypothetical protein [bacterium]